jgi:hypothetical protein
MMKLRHRLPACLLAAPAGLLLTACAQPPAAVPGPQALSIEQRLQNLEWRFDALERHLTNLPAPPLRQRGEIVQNIEALESRRTALLTQYTGAHPEVREVELSLRLLRLQLEMLDQAAKAAKPAK